MARFKLVPYIVRVKNKDSKDYSILDNISTIRGTVDFIDIFQKLLNSYREDAYIPFREQKTFSVENLKFHRTKRLIHGIIKSGEYGYETDFYDIIQKKRIQGARKKEHSEEFPFFFIFHSPLNKNPDRGFLILQKFKNFGIKYILTKACQEYIQKLDNSLNVEIHPLINPKLIKKVESLGRIIELKFIKRAIPKDIADKILIENYEDVYEERSFKIKRNKDIKFKEIENIFSKLRNVKYPYFEIENEKYDRVKVVIEKGKTRRTVYLEDLPRFRESLPLDEKKLILERGFPIHKSILKEALEYLNIILESFDENKIGG